MEKSWILLARKTAIYHRNKKRLNINHTLKDTAKELNRSIGSISESLLIANWLKTHSIDIEKCKTSADALEFIRNRKRMLESEDFDND